jgi:glucose-6-phosphate 1-dehydrogenase
MGRTKQANDTRLRRDRAAASDALVVFGVTGDLAHKMIFPALYGMRSGTH